MPRLTPGWPEVTTRKLAALCAGVLLVGFGLTGAGCATPGPNHLYTVAPAATAVITDHAAAGIATQDVPSFVPAGATLLGLAYDPFTDHLFLRLDPGNRFIVVDRPAHAVKYRFTAAGVPATGGGDIAIRSRDRHLFLSDPNGPVLIEITLYGQFVRTIPLAGLEAPPLGVAYDQSRNLLYVITAAQPQRIQGFDLSGRAAAAVTLDRPVHPGALAYDSAAQEFYLQTPGLRHITVFSRDGRFLRELASPELAAPACFDVGPRSFLRLF